MKGPTVCTGDMEMKKKNELPDLKSLHSRKTDKKQGDRYNFS